MLNYASESKVTILQFRAYSMRDQVTLNKQSPIGFQLILITIMRTRGDN